MNSVTDKMIKATYVMFAYLLLLIAVKSATGSRGYGEYTDSQRNSLGEFANFTELTRTYGYITEEHTVTTEDGYVLSVFRIPRGKNCRGSVREPPVLLMHGLLLTSDSWVDNGPSAGLPYLISDACYDVWVGNVRGTYYGRKHNHLDPDSDAEFWNFSYHEIAIYDVPATIDYMLSHTNADYVNFIGFSQGGRLLFIMCSEKLAYCDKIKVAILLSPAVYLKHSKSTAMNLLILYYTAKEASFKDASELEIAHRGGQFHKMAHSACRNDFIANAVCPTFFNILDIYQLGSFSSETLKNVFVHYPGGTSVRNLAFYGQNLIANRFQKYDYGPSGNLNMYGDVQPPLYDLNLTKVPVVLVYGKNDKLVVPKDNKWLARQLPNTVEAYEVANPLWTHFDNCYSQWTGRWIFPKINQYLEKYSETNSG